MLNQLEVLFTPAEFSVLPARDLSCTTCVVFDVLRATTSMLTALHHGATAVLPVAAIPETIALRARQPGLLLAGEREGLRITAAQSGGVEFDLGNSPREFTVARVQNRTIAMTTTNGTSALQACLGAAQVWVGGFVNLEAMVARLRRDKPQHLLLVCAGTYEEAAFEDSLAAGAVCDGLWSFIAAGGASDSAEIARQVYLQHAVDLPGAMRHSRNGRRLLSLPDLAADVAVCLDRNSVPLLGCLRPDGRVMRSE